MATERGVSPDDKGREVQHLAQLFSTCVECFGLIHQSVDFDRAQSIQLTKLGIQQARLLAWGDNVGITESDSRRDSRLDDPIFRPAIETRLQNIIDRPAHVHRVTQFEKYGLKPPRKFTSAYRPALDVARLEGFREKFEHLNQERWEVRRGMSITAHHWAIVDTKKFGAFLALIRENVDALVDLLGNGEYVGRAVKADIKAFGWHPIFDNTRATADSAKLRLIREACEVEYPDYAAATAGALAYIDREWKESYADAMDKYRGRDSLGHNPEDSGSEIPGAADKLARQAAGKAASSSSKERKPSLFNIFRPKSWRGHSSRDSSRNNSVSDAGGDQTPQRSMSLAEPVSTSHQQERADAPSLSTLTPPMTPEQERSKSISHFPVTAGHEERQDSYDLTKVATATSLADGTIAPVTSMISRHDMYRS